MTCYVLTRPDLVYHALDQPCPDSMHGAQALYDKKLLCGQQTPTAALDILQYTTARPQEGFGELCHRCMQALHPEHDTRADLDAQLRRYRVGLEQHASELRTELKRTEDELEESEGPR